MTWILPIIVFLIAAGYAAVGLGGGTAYLAVLSFWSYDPQVIRPLAWGLNILAASIGFINYCRAGHFSWRFSFPLVISGTAGGAVGARLPIETGQFSWLLAITLFAVALRMLFKKSKSVEEDLRQPLPLAVIIILGFVVGIASGLVGIGGGIILGPILLALRQAPVKTMAAMTSLYVALSSAGALGAHLQAGGTVDLVWLATLGVICMLGAFLGSRYGARKADPRILELIFGSLVMFAAMRLVWLSI